ncbi:uncharacterized protein KLLA0_C04477g [Kluyveromyces lactis]|uniref:KLLA0C04477p n=1 Tax=Kluyveromyces lactis (strain ATCC 8585 / CBS 2359 / DSM 70799 / NBRC 1267 / NRRL Y-1140 / WM37) TaxID=284590 RepID=Q6CUJ1_KLULA|nr:uncharacterized protein KLLA0_C04477g [Kluyveromyces lactis]CAH01249.1 KLLA0C04477p [Kluyveromyces lactis]|eukprot:XP_452398.1 uncharacterized protein KLLA0_C04477g [Kluyveromyces lactis]
MLENELSFVSLTRVSLNVIELNIHAKDATIVNNVSFSLPNGQLMAIIGGSGSGKTTMLNVLAGKTNSSINYDGEIQYSRDAAKEGSKADEKVTTAYLTQHDALAARLTCRETLRIAADLKLHLPKQERYSLVEELIAELGLRDCSETFVGDSINKGLSGGEKRRLSIAVQMIANPSVLFLDEPTTGLDAYSAFLLIKTLKKLCEHGGRTIIMSIHQPRSDILFALDQVCLLSKGFPMYCGAVVGMVEYFSSMGYTVPERCNPADYLIDICSVDNRTEKSTLDSEGRWNMFASEWQERCSTKYDTSKETAVISVDPSPPSVSILQQTFILTKRNFLLSSRDRLTLFAVQFEPVIVGIVVGWIFYKPDQTSESGLRTIAGALYIVGSIQGYLLLLLETYRLSELDIKIYDRERSEGCVTAFSYLMARRLSNLVQEDILIPLLFAIITYFMFGLEANAGRFFTYFGCTLVSHQTSVAVAYMAVSISRDFSKAGLVGNLTFTLQSMACGFFVNAEKMPVYVRWTKYIAYLWYTFSALMSNTFSNFGCHQINGSEVCTGDQYIDTFGIPKNWISVPIIITFCWAIGFYLVGLLFFQFKTVDVTLAKQVSTKKKNSNEEKDISVDTSNESVIVEEKLSNESITEGSEISIDLQDISLSVRQIQLFEISKKKLIGHSHKDILCSVNASFRPNAINAIMGPSGSGKTSLLNLISDRVCSNFFTKFNESGRIIFNQQPVMKSMFKSVCCYVSQDDNHLLPNLTVYETLKYAARLRLSHHNESRIETRVRTLISDLGLKNCANTLVGNDLIKGISGGEKRRVSIGIQLLTDPSVLLLDEPTSGLDSFTSSTIIELLKKLCQQGKTIILTIHQPRAEVFADFGNVLLLAKGGRVAFNGYPSAMIEYFNKEGFTCPQLTNIADYLLDVISVNIQNYENEVSSKERVNALIEKWRVISSKDVRNVNPTMTHSEFTSLFAQHIRHHASVLVAYKVCLSRQFKVMTRNIDSCFARLAQVPGMAAILTIYFAPLKNNFTGVMNRLGLTQQYTSLYFCGMLLNLAVYPAERDNFYQEFHDNIYGIGPFLCAYMTLEFPMAVLSAILFSVLTVMGIGLPRTAQMLFISMYCSFIITTCGEAWGIVVNTLFNRPGFVVNVVSIILSISSIMSGILSLNMPKFWKGLNYVSPVHYTSMILINYSFPDQMKFTCNDGGRNSDGSCLFNNGRDVIDNYGLHVNTSVYLGVLAAVWVVYRIIPYLILKADLELFKR